MGDTTVWLVQNICNSADSALVTISDVSCFFDVSIERAGENKSLRYEKTENKH